MALYTQSTCVCWLIRYSTVVVVINRNCALFAFIDRCPDACFSVKECTSWFGVRSVAKSLNRSTYIQGNIKLILGKSRLSFSVLNIGECVTREMSIKLELQCKTFLQSEMILHSFRYYQFKGRGKWHAYYNSTCKIE